MLSRHGRKKQRREAAQDDQGERDQEEILNPPPPPQASSDMMDRVDPGALCQHLLDRVPPEQFEGAMQSLATSFLQAIAGKAHERGILDEAAGRAFVDRFVWAAGGWLVQDVCWKGQGEVKEKLEFSSLPRYEEEVLF